jgi:hypothetical protein
MARSIPVRRYRKRINGKTITVDKHKRVIDNLQEQGIHLSNKESSWITNVATIKRINVQEGTLHFLGASSSPDLVYIEKVEPNIISIRRYPYYKIQRIQRPIADDLINSGDNTVYKQGPTYTLGSHTLTNYQYQNLGKKVSLDEMQRVEVDVVTNGEDWNTLERMGYSVYSQRGDSNQFNVTTTKAGVEELKKKFKVLTVKERQ